MNECDISKINNIRNELNTEQDQIEKRIRHSILISSFFFFQQ